MEVRDAWTPLRATFELEASATDRQQIDEGRAKPNNSESKTIVSSSVCLHMFATGPCTIVRLDKKSKGIMDKEEGRQKGSG